MKKNNVKNHLVKLFTVLAIAGTFTLAGFASESRAYAGNSLAAGRCGLHTLRGGYGLKATGTFFLVPPTPTSPPSNPVLLATVGRLVFDGSGNFTGTDSTSFGGAISQNATTGTYTVEPDCTGTLNVTFANGFTAAGSIVVVDEGKEIFYIETVPGTVVTGTMKRQ
ncbi:MAG: hypothetical protein ABR577_00135 [Pyrinomonadaceae bacterium]